MLIIQLICALLAFSPTAQAKEGGGGGSSGGHYGIALTPNIPHLIDLSYETVNRASHLTYSLGSGYIPPITISTATVGAFNVEVKARWHPFAGAFFFGLASGYHSYTGSGSTTLTVAAQQVPITVKDTLTGSFITPSVGWMWFFGRLIVGLEVGSQTGIGSSNKFDLTINNAAMQAMMATVQADPTYATFQTSINDAIKTLTSLPYVGFKLGWMF